MENPEESIRKNNPSQYFNIIRPCHLLAGRPEATESTTNDVRATESQDEVLHQSRMLDTKIPPRHRKRCARRMPRPLESQPAPQWMVTATVLLDRCRVPHDRMLIHYSSHCCTEVIVAVLPWRNHAALTGVVP